MLFKNVYMPHIENNSGSAPGNFFSLFLNGKYTKKSSDGNLTQNHGFLDPPWVNACQLFFVDYIFKYEWM